MLFKLMVCVHICVCGETIMEATSTLEYLYPHWAMSTKGVTNNITRCTRGVRVVFSRAGIRSSNRARMNKSNFTTEKIV